MEKDKRTKASIFFNKSDHTKIKIFCAEQDISIQEFLEHAGLYCLEKKIVPKKKD
ncbi:MAG: hypothetical protein GY754_22095 [bacterium]|nr:hypothetical protein [bacterium]